MENVISQLKKFFDEKHISQKEVADTIGIKPQYVNASFSGRRAIGHKIAEQLKLPHITAYTARYTWASLAASIDVPIEVISQALGHSYGLAVTLGYIVPDRRKVDEANKKVLALLFD